MGGHTAFGREVLLGHNAQCYSEAVEFDRHMLLAPHLFAVDIEHSLIVPAVIGYLVRVEFTRFEVRIFLENAEVFRSPVSGTCTPGKGRTP